MTIAEKIQEMSNNRNAVITDIQFIETDWDIAGSVSRYGNRDSD